MIRPEFRPFYGPAWRRYRAYMLALRGSRCTACGREIAKFLNLAHLTHDPRTSSVAFLCAACHARHDAAHSFAIARRTRAARVGQLWLSEEIETQQAPAPRQTELFT